MKNFWASLQGKIVGWLIVLAILMGIYAEAILAYKNTEDAKTATEIANNAAKLKLAEAEERAQLAKKAAADAEASRAAADNAAKLKLAEAEERTQLAKKAAADAEKAKEDAKTAAAIAENSKRRQQAEADDAEAKARFDSADANIQEYVSGLLAHPSGKGLATDMTNATLPKALGGHGYQAAAQPDLSQIQPKCRQPFADWQSYTSHAAFAVYGAGECVWSHRNNSYASTAQAVEALKNYCNQNRLACNVIATK